jgi:hypothetical protein
MLAGMRIARPLVTLATMLVALALLFAPSTVRADEGTTPPPRAKSGLSLTEGGLATFFAGYAWAAGTGAVYRDRSGRVIGSMFIPVIGPIKADRSDKLAEETTLTGRAIEATGANNCRGDAAVCPAVLVFIPFAIVEYAMLYVGPALQATGLVLTIVGLAKDESSTRDREHAAAPPKTREPTRPKVSVTPTVATGVGLSLSVTQW